MMKQRNILEELALTNSFQFQRLFGSEKELTDKIFQTNAS